jgi:hypothetical protein
MICGPCAIQKHQRCSGLLRTEFGFCACSDRGHLAEDASDDDKAVESRVNCFPSERARGSTAPNHEVL